MSEKYLGVDKLLDSAKTSRNLQRIAAFFMYSEIIPCNMGNVPLNHTFILRCSPRLLHHSLLWGGREMLHVFPLQDV